MEIGKHYLKDNAPLGVIKILRHETKASLLSFAIFFFNLSQQALPS